ncbi:hypothetical protein [Klenkia taihuensis]|uniref:ABC transporter n=1 Tax=Klenkia taihuensis TaxID=1225127 RepID=A0A1I1U774_9ACTN|nr:hypothetical protein [Klenkia taihuensis]GHE07060.1 lipoprotein [Klenkia taihuensis]SFD63760.1 hypothetical protein SAMN05661030_3839 [Klenkia taihuensis]
MPHPPRARRPRWCLGATAALALTACGAGPASPSADGPPPATPHGYVAGAEELPEPQLQLAYTDAGGSAHALDLLTGETAELGQLGPVDTMATDGRFLFTTSTGTGELTVVDTGTWTVDHGDHVHYYRAPARVVGSMTWSGDVEAASSDTLTALFSPTSGTGVVLDRAALGRGELTELATVESEPHQGALVPLGNDVVATDGTSVRGLDADGRPLPDAEAPCADPRGGHATRVGVVVSCADGAVLVTEADGGVELEQIPYPTPVAEAERASGLDNRPGRPSVAAPAGTRGVWLLDTRARSWQLVPTPTPWVTAVAADDEADRVVGVDTTGQVVVLEPGTGAVTGTGPLLPVDRLTEVDVHVDADRTYVNVPGSTDLLEVDHADGARVARTFSAEVVPAHLAETGR